MAIGSERIFSVVMVKWFAFLNKDLRGGEMATVETRSEPHDSLKRCAAPIINIHIGVGVILLVPLVRVELHSLGLGVNVSSLIALVSV